MFGLWIHFAVVCAVAFLGLVVERSQIALFQGRGEVWNMTGTLTGKVALITGASRGIGQGIAIGFGAAGAHIAVNYKTDSVGAELVCKQICEDGGGAEAFQADIGDATAFEELVDSVCQHFGCLDILVNNAARTRFGPLFEVTKADFDEVVDTNLKGPFFGSIAAAKKMLQSNGGSIINVSSCAVKLMMPFHSAYTMAKGGLESLTRQLALELAPMIRVNAIMPGATSTERNRAYDGNFDEKWSNVIPAGRVGQPADYVGPAIFLASNASSLVTGQILDVTGGWTLQGYTPNMTNFDFSRERK
jgi:NAD(P)-dependent dehydrogenase (short-subunit alcohol dehydrogenase family)